MTAFSIGIVLNGSLSLFVLTFVNDILSSKQEGPLSILQPVDGQEEDEEEETGDEEDDDDDDGEANNNEDENGDEDDDDNRQTNSIDVCCSWDERLADGVLTYKIIREEESNEDEDEDSDQYNESEEENIRDVSVELKKAVKDAIQEWNSKFSNLRLNEISSSPESEDADIEVQFVDGFAGMVAGATMIRYDGDGLIDKTTIILPRAAFFIENESEVFGVQYSPEKLKEIAIHEMGHALGLGHANFDADIMSQRLSSEGTMNISQCDINGVLQANYWKLVNNDNSPDNPNVSYVNC